ncbi:MAG: neutral zinc metallopeptidase [Micropepsaceae bacterium]
MKTEGRRQSEKIEDRRGQSAGGRRFPGGPIGAGGGLGLIIIVVLALFLGVDPRQLIEQATQGDPGAATEQPAGPYQETAQEAKRREMIAVVLAETEDTWTAVFKAAGKNYEKPALVLFSGQVESNCGFAQAAAGPFYCPADQRVFLDLSFFDDMSSKLGAAGDFAMAYVVAHEVGHHVQTLLGISNSVNTERQQVSEAEANALSVKLELQADCLAGIWANREQKQQVLEAGDIEEAVNAAAAVGDDRLQKRAKGYVVPESFTHGSSADRVKWFKTGLQTGDMNQCDTFAGGN